MASVPACGPVPGVPSSTLDAVAAVRVLPPDREEACGPFTFPRCCRLVHSHQFKDVYKNRKAKRTRGRIVACVWVPNGQPVARLGFAVPKRVLRRSSSRNMLKRLVREYFRLNPLSGVDLIVSCCPGARPPLDRKAIRRDLVNLWDRIAL